MTPNHIMDQSTLALRAIPYLNPHLSLWIVDHIIHKTVSLTLVSTLPLSFYQPANEHELNTIKLRLLSETARFADFEKLAESMHPGQQSMKSLILF